MCSAVVWLNPGDYIEGIARHTGSVARNLNNQKELCYMDISLADAAPISNNVRVAMSATQSIPTGRGILLSSLIPRDLIPIVNMVQIRINSNRVKWVITL